MLEARDIRVRLPSHEGGPPVCIVRGISFVLKKGSSLGLVGESGCGKTMTGLSIMGMLPPGSTVTGELSLDGTDLASLSGESYRRLRGNRISMIFQDPASALNPLIRVGEQISETIREHKGADRETAWRMCVEWIGKVGLRSPGKVARMYPHQLSGGMRQRIIIAQALCCSPELLIADEPTTALDVSLQRQILELLQRMRRESGAAIILISHDIAIVSNEVENIAVMYAGRMVETGPVGQVLSRPGHPYTRLLLKAIPGQGAPGERLESISGTPPDFGKLDSGCSFRQRCPQAFGKCSSQPPVVKTGEDAQAECWLAAP